MVIPWVGIPLSDVIKRFRPTCRANYVKFTTLVDPKQMPAQGNSGLSFLSMIDWPYVEGLCMDEAMMALAGRDGFARLTPENAHELAVSTVVRGSR